MTTTSPLLGLPAELRNQIYRLAIVKAKVRIDVTRFRHPSEPGLLATCAQIRSEALHMYYAENRFVVRVPGSLAFEYKECWNIWLSSLNSSRSTLITHIDMEFIPFTDMTLSYAKRTKPNHLPYLLDIQHGSDVAARRSLAHLQAVVDAGVKLEAIEFENPQGFASTLLDGPVVSEQDRWKELRASYKEMGEANKDIMVREVARAERKAKKDSELAPSSGKVKGRKRGIASSEIQGSNVKKAKLAH